MIKQISVLGGIGKLGQPDCVERLDLAMGDIVSIVGATGSGKTTLINDIELFADRDTPSQRQILINGNKADARYRDDPAMNPIALITQHTNFVSDLPVETFLMTHAMIRNSSKSKINEMIEYTLDFANQLTGEAIDPHNSMTELSGGQTRALLIADATIICDTPIILLDEVENAGIDRSRAIDLLRQHRKIFIFVTHDPRIVLWSDYRIIMKEGAINKLIATSSVERSFASTVNKIDNLMIGLRDSLRSGRSITSDEIATFNSALQFEGGLSA